ncbi:hypothetical protein C2845_PM03G13680 [Panicum miliaceum]|uniref:RING-type domain-containing protein n=1 Tax=Panicum miliaceum TaxID=4540 RepID=A0A3L6T667_PANMI|nr:hypothetical protein C2845_PM03G13680 [Panicum miliaceum]
MDLAAASQKAAAAAWSEDDEEDYDDPDREALRFRKHWNYVWSRHYGSFEDTTPIPPVRFTDEPPVERLKPCHTLQIFSAKVAGIGGGFQFQWPLDVFGLVAIRDSVDRNRNIIFQRSRDECQTITGEDPYLELTGPTRAVLLWDPVDIEVYLKVKGPSELEDKTLCFLAKEILCQTRVNSCLLHRTWTSKFSTLEFTLGHINSSVEATIFVRVVDGSWPDGFHVQFAACMVSSDFDDKVPAIAGSTSVDDKKIVLLSFGDEKVPAMVDGVIELSRRVVSVETTSKLKVSVNAWQDDNNVVEAWAEFSAKETVKAGEVEGGGPLGDCAICLDSVEDAGKEMPCGHRFHGECLERWLGVHGNCPACRRRRRRTITRRRRAARRGAGRGPRSW